MRTALVAAVVAAAQLVDPSAAQSLDYEVPGAPTGALVPVHGALYLAPGEAFEATFRSARRGWVRTHAVARHRDGSVRWLGVTGQLPTRGVLVRDEDPVDVVGEAEAWMPPTGIVARGPAGGLSVDGATWTFHDGAGVSRVVLEPPTIVVEDGEGTRVAMRAEPTTLVRQASWPDGGAFEGRGGAVAPDGARLEATWFVESAVGGRCWSVEGRLSVPGHQGLTFHRAALNVRVVDGADWEATGDGLLPAADGRCVQVAPDRVRCDSGEAPLEGRLAESFLARDASGVRATIAIPRLPRYWPIALERRGGDVLVVDLIPNARPMARGRSFGFRLEIALEQERIDGLPWPVRRRGVHVALPGFVGDVRSVRHASRPALQRLLDEHLGELVAWMARAEGGVDHYGDLPLAERGSERTWSRLEFDPVRGLVLEWLRGGAPQLLDVAADLAFHHRTHAIPAAYADAERVGLPLRHVSAADEAARVVDVGHAWLEGHLLLGRVLSRPSVASTAFAMHRALLGVELDPRRDGDLERTFAWPLLGLAAVCEEGGSEANALGIARWSDRLLARFDPHHGGFEFDGRRLRSGGRVLSPWLAGGLLLLAMDRALPYGSRPGDGEAAADALAETVWDAAYDRGARAFAARVLLGRPGGEPVRIAWCDGPREALLLAGLARRAARGSDELRRLEERVRRAGPSLLRLEPERRFNDLALLLWSTPVLLGTRFGK